MSDINWYKKKYGNVPLWGWIVISLVVIIIIVILAVLGGMGFLTTTLDLFGGGGVCLDNIGSLCKVFDIKKINYTKSYEITKKIKNIIVLPKDIIEELRQKNKIDINNTDGNFLVVSKGITRDNLKSIFKCVYKTGYINTIFIQEDNFRIHKNKVHVSPYIRITFANLKPDDFSNLGWYSLSKNTQKIYTDEGIGSQIWYTKQIKL